MVNSHCFTGLQRHAVAAKLESSMRSRYITDISSKSICLIILCCIARILPGENCKPLATGLVLRKKTWKPVWFDQTGSPSGYTGRMWWASRSLFIVANTDYSLADVCFTSLFSASWMCPFCAWELCKGCHDRENIMDRVCVHWYYPWISLIGPVFSTRAQHPLHSSPYLALLPMSWSS